MRRVPIVPTIVVALAVAAMIALGLWQLLDRLPQKEAFLAQLAANPAKSAIPFPRTADDSLLFRRATGDCVRVRAQRLAGAGHAGFRVIADCVRGGGGASMPVQLGTTHDPAFTTNWAGGEVTGYISHAPSSQSLIGAALHHQPQPLLLVADTPPPGLAPNGAPDLSTVPNNHLAYAWQWFFFAAIASVIYVLALRRRRG
jgi:surfeit locus 1 family protein